MAKGSYYERMYYKATKAYVAAESKLRLLREDVIEAKKQLDAFESQTQSSMFTEEENDNASNG